MLRKLLKSSIPETCLNLGFLAAVTHQAQRRQYY